MALTLVNTTRSPLPVMAEDGDTILIPIGEHNVPDKFNWNLPAGIRVARSPVNSVKAPSPVSRPVNSSESDSTRSDSRSDRNR